MWVLVAADGQSELPVIDGREVPLISSGQRARVPDAWLKNAPLATAATAMSTTTIDTGRLLADLQRLVKSLKADLLERSREVPEVDAGLRAAHRAIAERRPHGAGVRGLARRLPGTGGGGLGAGLRLRPVHGGQRPHRRDATWPATGDRRAPGRGRARALLPRRTRTTPTASTCSTSSARSARSRRPRDLFAEGKTPLWAVGPSGDAATRLLAFWREIDPETAHLRAVVRGRGGRHPVPRRPLPGPLRGGPQEVRAAADPGVRRGVHPRPHARRRRSTSSAWRRSG